MKTINPDGIPVNVAWERAERGASFFIPCVNTRKAKRQVKDCAKDQGLTVKSKVVIEFGRLGLRVWIQ